MKNLVIVALAVFWAVMALRAYQRHDLLLAGTFLVVGAALTVYRVTRR